MYWPDNEPFPERGQIRPPWPGGVGTGAGGAGTGAAHGLGPQSVVAGPAANGGIGGGLDPGSARNMAIGVMPPILNTGNKGPIEQQPGDWVCRKCNYLVSVVPCCRDCTLTLTFMHRIGGDGKSVRRVSLVCPQCWREAFL